MSKCERCKGFGRLFLNVIYAAPYDRHEARQLIEEDKCPDCNGTGTISGK
jgi:hypothetical protein